MRQRRFHHKFDKFAVWPLDGQVYISFQKPGGSRLHFLTKEPNNHKFKLKKKEVFAIYVSCESISLEVNYLNT